MHICVLNGIKSQVASDGYFRQSFLGGKNRYELHGSDSYDIPNVNRVFSKTR